MMATQCGEKERRDRERVEVMYVDGAFRMSNECQPKMN
jgi:hypothetical protein